MCQPFEKGCISTFRPWPPARFVVGDLHQLLELFLVKANFVKQWTRNGVGSTGGAHLLLLNLSLANLRTTVGHVYVVCNPSFASNWKKKQYRKWS